MAKFTGDTNLGHSSYQDSGSVEASATNTVPTGGWGQQEWDALGKFSTQMATAAKPTAGSMEKASTYYRQEGVSSAMQGLSTYTSIAWLSKTAVGTLNPYAIAAAAVVTLFSFSSSRKKRKREQQAREDEERRRREGLQQQFKQGVAGFERDMGALSLAYGKQAKKGEKLLYGGSATSLAEATRKGLNKYLEAGGTQSSRKQSAKRKMESLDDIAIRKEMEFEEMIGRTQRIAGLAKREQTAKRASGWGDRKEDFKIQSDNFAELEKEISEFERLF